MTALLELLRQGDVWRIELAPNLRFRAQSGSQRRCGEPCLYDGRASFVLRSDVTPTVKLNSGV